MQTISEYYESGRNNFHLIRLVSALAVIYGHSYALTGQPGSDIFLRYVGYKFIGGVAVNVFFVISGFLIAASLERSSIRRFVAARILRIYPALLVCVALCVLVLGPLLTTDPSYWSNRETWRYFLRNGLLIDTEYHLPGVFLSLRDQGVNGSLWSLPVEIRLYGLFLLLSLCRLFSPRRFAPLALVAIVVGYFAAPNIPVMVAYANWVDSAMFFLAGGFVWHFRDSISLNYPTLAVLLVAGALVIHTDRFGAVYFMLLVYLTFFIAFVPQIIRIRQTDLSYGIYLYGWPAQQLVQLFRHCTSALENTMYACALSLCLAFMSWKLIEQPALSLKRLFKN